MKSPIATSTLEALVAAGVRAPSSHNTQPWLFELGDDTIDVWADRTRALPVNDPHDRELTISCGAAVFNLSVAAGHHGLDPIVELLPDASQPDLMARVTLEPAGTRAPDPLFDMIGRRRTTRGSFADSIVLQDVAEALAELADAYGVHLYFVDGDDRDQLADLVAEGDRIQFADRRWRRELAGWMRPRRHGEGLVVPEVLGLGIRAVVSTINLGKSTAGKDRELLRAAPLAAIIATDHDDPESWLVTGRALQHVLLRAAGHDLHAGFLNQPCQVDILRERLRRLDPQCRHPQIVLRLGTLADPPPATPRRPIDAVIVETAERPSE